MALEEGSTDNSTNPSSGVRALATRTLIPLQLSTSLTFVTVPWDDLGEELKLEQVMSYFFSVPRTKTINDSQYKTAIRLIRNRRIWEALEFDQLRLFGGYPRDAPTEVLATQARRQIDYSFAVLNNIVNRSQAEWQGISPSVVSSEAPSLAEHAAIFRLDGAPERDISAHVRIFSYYPRYAYVLARTVEGQTKQILDEENISAEAFSLALRIYSAVLVPSEGVRGALKEAYDYDIPFGNSPDGTFGNLGSIFSETTETVAALVNLSVPSPPEEEFISFSRARPKQGKPSGLVQGPMQVTSIVETEIRKAGVRQLEETQ